MRQLLLRTGFPADQITLSDEEYSLPDTAYPAALGRRYYTLLTRLGVPFAANRFDCDKFARLAATQALLEHAAFSSKETGLAFGVAYILTDTSAHALNICVHRENGHLVVRLYEPQPQPANPRGSYLLVCLKEFPQSEVRSWVACWF